MAAVLGHGPSLIEEYIELIAEYLKDSDTMRSYLRGRRLELPANLSYSG